MITKELQRFIEEHANDDPMTLLLSASRYPGIDMHSAVEQIASRSRAKDKLIEWQTHPEIFYPSELSVEQCSSEATAGYKQRLVTPSFHVCDLTGGLGVDSYYFSRKARKVTYIERYPDYCESAQNNFKVLNAGNITVLEGEASSLLPQLQDVGCFYIDPARRGEDNKRVYALEECEPDLTTLLPRLFGIAPKVIAKLSPMLDIQHTLEQLPETVAIHILSVKNECKELIFELEKGASDPNPPIHSINFTTEGKEQSFQFTREEERTSPLLLAKKLGQFLYESNASILKGGAYKCTAARFGLQKLHTSSHLYTSDEQKAFPGRVFTIEETLPFKGKILKQLSQTVPRANITIRNFPLSVNEIRKRTKIKEGGRHYLFATTLADDEKVLIRCTKIAN